MENEKETTPDASKQGFKYKVQKLKLPDFDNQVFKPKNLKVVQSSGQTSESNDQLPDEPYNISQQSTSPKRSLQRPKFANTKKSLNLNIDAINEMFTFGGEKGDFEEETLQQNLENDIKELAAVCVKAMRESRKQKTSFQELISGSDDRKDKENMFMVSQTVKGIKTIHEEQKKNKSQGFGLSLTHILEENSQTSKSSISKPNGTFVN